MNNPFAKIAEYAARYDQWARVRQITPVITQDTHTCTNCGTEFCGRYCPQCGLRATLMRLKLKNLFFNFMDIWGMGSRPMFRTIKEMFTRPGYMIRDYLMGHQPLYFPPFKMLVVFTVIFLASAWLREADIEHNISIFSIFDEDKYILSDHAMAALGHVDRVLSWLSDHLAFAVVALQVFSVLATKMAFHRCKTQWSLVELFFAFIYTSSRYYILEVASIWILGNDIDDADNGCIFAIINAVLMWLTYKQLYDIKLWKALGLGVLAYLLQFLIIVLVVILFAAIIALI